MRNEARVNIEKTTEHKIPALWKAYLYLKSRLMGLSADFLQDIQCITPKKFTYPVNNFSWHIS